MKKQTIGLVVIVLTWNFLNLFAMMPAKTLMKMRIPVAKLHGATASLGSKVCIQNLSSKLKRDNSGFNSCDELLKKNRTLKQLITKKESELEPLLIQIKQKLNNVEWEKGLACLVGGVTGLHLADIFNDIPPVCSWSNISTMWFFYSIYAGMTYYETKSLQGQCEKKFFPAVAEYEKLFERLKENEDQLKKFNKT